MIQRPLLSCPKKIFALLSFAFPSLALPLHRHYPQHWHCTALALHRTSTTDQKEKRRFAEEVGREPDRRLLASALDASLTGWLKQAANFQKERA